jgi:hypothetical protein
MRWRWHCSVAANRRHSDMTQKMCYNALTRWCVPSSRCHKIFLHPITEYCTNTHDDRSTPKFHNQYNWWYTESDRVVKLLMWSHRKQNYSQFKGKNLCCKKISPPFLHMRSISLVCFTKCTETHKCSSHATSKLYNANTIRWGNIHCINASTTLFPFKAMHKTQEKLNFMYIKAIDYMTHKWLFHIHS